MEPVQESQAQGLDLYWQIALRRRWWILVPFVLGWAMVLGASWVIPPKYKSESLILVEQQRVPDQYVTPNVTLDISARLNAMTEQIMSRTQLQRIAEKFNLYKGTKTDSDKIVDALRKDINIDLQTSRTNRGEQLTAFKLSYVTSNPILAQNVTQELTSLFIDTSIKHSSEMSEHTTRFLQGQLDIARKDLDEQEAKLREFKTQNLGQLPEQLQTNVQILTGLQGRLQAATDTLNRAEEQRMYLESLRERYRGARAAATSTADSPVTVSSVDQQLEKLHQQLTELQAKYTDKHPDVIRTKSEIASAEALKAKIEKQLASQSTTAPAKPKSFAEMQAEAPLIQIESQLKANEIEIANDKTEINNIKGQIGQYQSRLNLTPMREQQLAAIIRDHEQSQKNYDELLKKVQQSGLATSLENQQQGEQFKLIDPPSLPAKPYFPDRSKMALIGIAVGIALGIVVAGLVEMMDLHVYTEAQVKDIVGAVMIVNVPALRTPSEVRIQHRTAWVQAFAATAIVLFVSSITAFTFFRG